MSYLFQWLFTYVTSERVIHTTRMDPRDLCFSLTDNWCVVWGPPFMAQFYCLSHRCPISHRPHYIIEDTSVHLGDHSPTTSLAPWFKCLARHWSTPLVGPNLRCPIITSGQRRPRTGWYTSPQSRVVTCSVKRLSPCR